MPQALSDYIGKELTGWRIERWYCVHFDYEMFKYQRIDYYKSKDLATAIGEKAGDNGRDLSCSAILVLTQDGIEGWIIDSGARLNDEAKAIEQVRQKNEPIKISDAAKKVLGTA